MDRRLMIIAVISGVIILALVISLAVVATREQECIPSEISPGSVHAASRILKDMNQKIEPCDDFYEFACGGYMASTPIPKDKRDVNHAAEVTEEIEKRLRMSLEEPSTPDELRVFKLVKDLYRTCVNKPDFEELDFQPLRDVLDRYGKWPVIEGDRWNEESFNWTESVYMSRELGYSADTFITLRVKVDLLNATKYIIKVEQPSVILERKILAEGIENEDVQAYFKQMVRIAVLLGADEKRAKDELMESLKFEMALTNVEYPEEIFLSIEDLEYQYSIVNWKEYINRLLPSTLNVDADEIVAIAWPGHLNDFEELMSNTSKRVQANYALWRVAAQCSPLLTKSNGQRQKDNVPPINKDIATVDDYRWKECVGNISHSSLSFITNALYVRNWFKEGERQKAIEMVDDIRTTMIEMLKKIDWMDDVTRSKAVEKAKYMLSQVGYPPELIDGNELEKFYADLRVSHDDLLGNVLQSNKILHDRLLGMLRKPVNKSDWVTHDYTTQVNAFYYPIENGIFIPAGILQGAFFEGDRPRYMDYGAIGFIIGHEMSHSFDPTGKKTGKDGEIVDWWTPETDRKYSEKAECVMNQYNNYTVKSIGMKVDGNKTLEENIADNGGIKTAYIAYKEYAKRNGPEPKLPGLKYTPEQMFWISAANIWCWKYKPQAERLHIKLDEHAHARFRVIGTLVNRPEFAADFNCPSGSYMNPVQKCSVL